MVKFHRGDKSDDNLAHNPVMRLLADCIISQANAGTKTIRGEPLIDIRQWTCPHCGSPGFNTGYGAIVHICGYELVGDMENSPCGKAPK